jgi:hypothetical protein
MSQVIFFTGAPDADSLNWDEEFLYQDAQSFSPPLMSRSESRPQFDGGNHDCEAQWRVLPLQHRHLTTGMTQAFETPIRDGAYGYTLAGKDVSFFTTTRFSIDEGRDKSETGFGSEGYSPANSEETLSQFYGQSLAVHEDLLESAVSLSQSSIGDSSFESPAVDHDNGQTHATGVVDSETERPAASHNLHLTDLENIPNASHLRSIEPQTVTVNLVVGIISISPSRTVKTRKWGREMEIIEMIVGDETKSGFGVTFWLPPSQDSHSHLFEANVMRQKLQKIRPQDVVLFQTVALASFRGQVHGQSLRRDLTDVQLLYRKKANRYDDGGAYSSKDFTEVPGENIQLQKTKRVREWVLNFLGVMRTPKGLSGMDNGKSEREAKRGRSPLPPDTQ